jgi:hypothetical protein
MQDVNEKGRSGIAGLVAIAGDDVAKHAASNESNDAALEELASRHSCCRRPTAQRGRPTPPLMRSHLEPQPHYSLPQWVGALVAAGTPKRIVDKLAAAFARILVMPDVEETLAAQGIDVAFVGPDAFASLLRADAAKYGRVIKNANIRMDN